MVMKYHNHKLQTNRRHHEEKEKETEKEDSNLT